MRSLILMLLLALCAPFAAQAQIAPPLPDAPQAYALHLSPESAFAVPPESAFTAPARSASIMGMEPLLYVEVQKPHPKVLDSKFLALGILTFAITAADVELTQHCLHAGTCYEMNPTLPNSRWGQYAVNTVTNSAVMYLSYRRRKAGKWGWWVAPIVDIGAHGVGLGSNIRFAR